MDDEGFFPQKGIDKKRIMSRIKEAKSMDVDFSSGRVFGSMCTKPLGIAEEIHSMFFEANLGNPGLYRGTEALEKEVLKAVAELIHAPSNCEKLSVGGGTEGNIMALWHARNITGKKKVVIPESAHFSFIKACDLLDMQAVRIPLDSEYHPDLEALEKAVDDKTAAVVGIAGTTELGLIDPIEDMSDLIGDVYFHVDAAFGGFVIPFLRELRDSVPPFDFELEGVDSIILDPHKMGLSTVPLGLYFSREEYHLDVKSPYLSGDGQNSIRGTRCSAPIPAFWGCINTLGKDGYVRLVEICMEKTRLLKEMGENIGLEKVVEPVLNIVAFHHDNPSEVVKAMEKRGWNISRTVNPPGLRFVVMPHVNATFIETMFKDLKEVL